MAPWKKQARGRLDKTGTHANDSSRGEAVGKPSVAGVYTNQRLNLSKLWEGSRRTCQGLKPDPGNLAVRHFRGASRTVRHGETVNPPAIERAGPETPHLQRARSISIPTGGIIRSPQRAIVLPDRPLDLPSLSTVQRHRAIGPPRHQPPQAPRCRRP